MGFQAFRTPGVRDRDCLWRINVRGFMASHRLLVSLFVALWGIVFSLSVSALDISTSEDQQIDYSEIYYFFDDQDLSAGDVLNLYDELPWQQATSILLDPPRSQHPKIWIHKKRINKHKKTRTYKKINIQEIMDS